MLSNYRKELDLRVDLNCECELYDQAEESAKHIICESGALKLCSLKDSVTIF